MRLRRLQRNWDRLGRSDPLWAVASDPAKRGRRWREDEFFALGEREIDATMQRLCALGAEPARGTALDFGCGVGRLTQALGGHFERVVGVDIAPSMLEHARRYNRHGARCTFVLNERADLSAFADGTFDFVYSNEVLQHVRPVDGKKYVAEFVRLLTASGVATFEVPSRRLAHRTRLPEVLDQGLARATSIARVVGRSVLRAVELVFPRMEMNAISPADVREVVDRAGGRVVDVEDTAPLSFGWIRSRYVVVRAGAGRTD